MPTAYGLAQQAILCNSDFECPMGTTCKGSAGSKRICESSNSYTWGAQSAVPNFLQGLGSFMGLDSPSGDAVNNFVRTPLTPVGVRAMRAAWINARSFYTPQSLRGNHPRPPYISPTGSGTGAGGDGLQCSGGASCGKSRCAAGKVCDDPYPFGEDTGTCIDFMCLFRRRCLSFSTRIATPTGDVSVTDLKVGSIVWTVDKNGTRAVTTLLRVNSVLVQNHRVVRLVLTDGRSADISPLHPTTTGSTVGSLRAGDTYDGSVVKSAELIPYVGDRTYDILPSGDTGFYFANGILMGSTLK